MTKRQELEAEIADLRATVARLHALVGEDADRVPLTAEIERLRAALSDFAEGDCHYGDRSETGTSHRCEDGS